MGDGECMNFEFWILNFLVVVDGCKQRQSWGCSSCPLGKFSRDWTPPCLPHPARWAWRWRTIGTCTCPCLPHLACNWWTRWPRRWWTTRTWTSTTGLQHPAWCELLQLSGQEPQQFMNDSLSLIKDSVQHLQSDPWRQKFPPYWIPENPSPLFSGYAQSRGTFFYSYAFSL